MLRLLGVPLARSRDAGGPRRRPEHKGKRPSGEGLEFWTARARTHLFRSKRALALASYLRARAALKEAFGKYKDRLVFLDFITDQKENVWPMVKAGRGLTEMLLGSEDL